MKRLWLLFSAVIILSFSVLGWIGTRIYQEAPPIADKVVTTAGVTVVGLRRDPSRTERLAVLGGHASRLDLGPRKLRRA